MDLERKFIDTSTDGGSVAIFLGTPLIVLMNGLATGSNNNQREGRQAKFLSFSARFRTLIAATIQDYQVRFFLVLDKQANGTTFALSTLINNSATTPLTGMRNLNNNKRFSVLKQWQMQGSLNSTATKVRAVHKRLNFLTRYNGNAATDGNIATNSLWLVACTNQADMDNRVNIEIGTRIRFVG